MTNSIHLTSGSPPSLRATAGVQGVPIPAENAFVQGPESILIVEGIEDHNEVAERIIEDPGDYDIHTYQVSPQKDAQKQDLEKKHNTITAVRVFLNGLDDLFTPQEKLGAYQNLHLEIQGMTDVLYTSAPKINQDPETLKAVLNSIKDWQEDIVEAKRLIQAKAEGTLTPEELANYPANGTPLDRIKQRLLLKNVQTGVNAVEAIFSRTFPGQANKISQPPTETQLFKDVSEKARRLFNRLDSLFTLQEEIDTYSETHLLLKGISEKFEQFPSGALNKTEALAAYDLLDKISQDIDDFQKKEQAIKEGKEQLGDQISPKNFKATAVPEYTQALYQALFPGGKLPKASPPTEAEYLKIGIQETRILVQKIDNLFSRSEQLGDFKDGHKLILGLKEWLDDAPTKGLAKKDLLKLLAAIEPLNAEIDAAKQEKTNKQQAMLATAKGHALGDIKNLSQALFGKLPFPTAPTLKENYSEGAGAARAVLGKLDDLLSKTAQNAGSAADGGSPLSLAHRKISALVETLYTEPFQEIDETTLKAIIDTVDAANIHIDNCKKEEPDRLLKVDEKEFRTPNSPQWDPYYAGDADESVWRPIDHNNEFNVLNVISALSKNLRGREVPPAPANTERENLKEASNGVRTFVVQLKNLLNRDEQVGTYHDLTRKMDGFIEMLYSPDGKGLPDKEFLEIFNTIDRFGERMSWIEPHYQQQYQKASKEVSKAKEEYGVAKEGYDNALADYNNAKERLALAEKLLAEAQANFDLLGIPGRLGEKTNAENALKKAEKSLTPPQKAMEAAENARQIGEQHQREADAWKKSMQDVLKPEMGAILDGLCQKLFRRTPPPAKESTPNENYREAVGAVKGILYNIENLFTSSTRRSGPYYELKALQEKLANTEEKALSRENLRATLALVKSVQEKLQPINAISEKNKRQDAIEQFLEKDLEGAVLRPITNYL